MSNFTARNTGDLYLSVRKGHGNIRVRGKYLGVEVNQSAGTRDRFEAEQVKQALKRDIYEQVVVGKRPPYYFEQALEDYINDGGEARFLLPLLDHFTGVEMGKIVNKDLVDAARAIYPEGSPATINRQLYTPFIAIYSLAALNDKCPPKKWKRPSLPEGRIDWRTPEDMERVLGHMAPKSRDLATFFLGAFSRAGETFSMTHDNVMPGNKRAVFYSDQTKKDYMRSVDLPSRSAEALTAAMTDADRGDVLWRTDGKGVPYKTTIVFNRHLKAACDEAGVEPITCHGLRHTGATWRYAMTKDLQGVMVQGGWKSLTMLQVYVHAGTDELADACNKHGWSVK